MGIKVIIESQAKPSERARLKSLLSEISATHGPTAPGFLCSTVYDALDAPDGLVEIADGGAAEAQASAVDKAMAAGIYVPVLDLVAAAFKATRVV